MEIKPLYKHIIDRIELQRNMVISGEPISTWPIQVLEHASDIPDEALGQIISDLEEILVSLFHYRINGGTIRIFFIEPLEKLVMKFRKRAVAAEMEISCSK